MRLRKLVMTSYRSVKQQEALITDDRITVLIGANDHGKSNILSAIECLNDEKLISADDKNWDAPSPSTVELRWHFNISDEILEKLRQFGPGKLEEGDPTPIIFEIGAEREIIFSRNSQNNTIEIVSLPVPVLTANAAGVLSLRPRVELFESPNSSVIDQVTLAQLVTPQFEFMQGIFRLAGLWDAREDIFVQNDTTSKLLEEASAKLTIVLNDRWNQGKELKWAFKHAGVNGDHILIQIEDPAIKGRFTRPSLRSSGFRTYFLLSMIIYARSQNLPSNSNIYLFDEPGTYLHPAAQLDLQRSFELIADNAQIFYTTHSLFLVSKNYPERNRVISKTKEGTKIDQKPFSKNWKSVRASLGILLSNNFLIAEKTLLVEGPSDVIYILDAIKKLKKLGSIDIDLNDISIVDAGDSANYLAMAKLMLSEGRSIVALLDGDNAGKKVKLQLERSCAAEMHDKRLQIHLLPENKSSEDIFANIESLKQAAQQAYEKLVGDSTRQAKADLKIEEEIEKIVSSENLSLGRLLDKTTKSWFEPADSISKLLIAILYEDVRENQVRPPPEASATAIQAIKNLLNLNGEKSQEGGVFEEVQ